MRGRWRTRERAVEKEVIRERGKEREVAAQRERGRERAVERERERERAKDLRVLCVAPAPLGSLMAPSPLRREGVCFTKAPHHLNIY